MSGCKREQMPKIAKKLHSGNNRFLTIAVHDFKMTLGNKNYVVSIRDQSIAYVMKNRSKRLLHLLFVNILSLQKISNIDQCRSIFFEHSIIHPLSLCTYRNFRDRRGKQWLTSRTSIRTGSLAAWGQTQSFP